jgi:pyoverdine/dityrosine biosynthesis protein Dit1/RimJ/RimL family protein N-acetyltransferase
MENDSKVKEFSFLEPFGHFANDSKIERYWQKFSGPFSLNRHRVPQFSVYGGMSHFPLKYTMVPFHLDFELPNQEWIISNLQTFIKTEFAETEQLQPNLPAEWPPKIDKVINFPSHQFNKFFASSEWSNRINIKIPNEDSPNAIANSIYDLLCDAKIGSHKNKSHNNREQFVNKIIPTIKEKSRLIFVFPGFPFKDQNRFRVPFDGGSPDFGEISFMIRLYNLTQTIYQVHPYGVDVVILTDGELYSNIFGVSPNMISDYSKRLIEYRNLLNLQGSISFISLKELIDRSSNDNTAWNIVEHIKSIITSLRESNYKEISKNFDVLIAGMKWNLDSRNTLKDVSDQDCWKILRWSKEELEDNLKDNWETIHQRATNAALEYAAINLMLRYTNLIHRFFPDAIRATIHPKVGQFALAGSGSTYAWNGVATSKKWPANVDDIRVTPFMSLNSFSQINEVQFENTGFPCFFTEGIYNRNIEAATNILASQGWSIENLRGREFKQSDIHDFIALGLGDANFTWERILQNENYFTGLFQFRLSHYKKYGFGIHGIWIDNKLIGQFGLQVLNENFDEVEFVIFLGNEYAKKGIGSKLVKELIKLCKEKGLTDLFGVVRPDNDAGLKLLEKVGGKQIKTVKHFNQEGILHQITLNKK